MTRLNLYVLKELFIVGLFSFVVLTLVATGGTLVQLFREFPSQGLLFILGAGPALFSYVIPYTLGIAAALAGTLVFGRLNGDRELDAIRTAGIPLSRLWSSVVLIGLLASIVAASFNFLLTPAAYRSRKRLEEKSITDILKRPPPGARMHRFGKKYLLRYENAVGSTLQRPYIVEVAYRESKESYAKSYYVAREAEIRFNAENVPVLILRDCHYGTLSIQKAADGSEVEQQNEGSAEEFPVEMRLEYTRDYREDLEGMTMGELLAEEKRAGSHPRAGQARTEFHLRIAGAVAPLPLLLLAAGIGMAVRTTTRLAGLGATLPSIALFVASRVVFGQMGDRGQLDPITASYLGVAMMAVLASGLLFWRTRR